MAELLRLVSCPEGYGTKGDQCVYVSPGRYRRGSQSDENGPFVMEIYVSSFFMDPREMTRGEWRRLFASNPQVYLATAKTCTEPISFWSQVTAFFGKEPSVEEPISYEAVTLDPNTIPADFKKGVRIDGKEICTVDITNITETLVRVSLPEDTRDDDFSVTDVSWYGAQAACLLKGGRLLTENEWEKAAREDKNCEYGMASCNEISTNDANNGYGASDMARNVSEWTADWYHGDYYIFPPDRDPQGPKTGKYKIPRGGILDISSNRFRLAMRMIVSPDYRASNLGLRCGWGRFEFPF